MPVYVLWIPCLESSLKVCRDRIESTNISDEGDFLVDAHLNVDTYEIRLTYQTEEQQQEMILSLFQKPSACFLHYQITKQTETASQLAKTMESEFHQGLYHLIKGFFHNHAFHPADEDSIIHARYFESMEQYMGERVSDADYYVQEYINKFDRVNKNINDALNEISKRTATSWKQVYYYLKTYGAYKRLAHLIGRYEGEFLYYKSLRSSVEGQLSDSKSVDAKMEALDNEIHIKQHLIEHEFSYNSAVIGTNISTVGMIVGAIGIILSVISLIISSSDSKAEKLGEIEERLGGIEQRISLSESKSRGIINRIEENTDSIASLSGEVEAMGKSLKEIQNGNAKIQKRLGVK